nr:GTPase Era [Alkalilimnicola sp. S0819]
MPCGFAALVGRPNVGKSTLLNRLLGQKISIVSRRPQTTRHRILGVHSTADQQIIYVDTPGLHRGGSRAMNRYLNRAADSSLDDVDVVVFLVEGLQWREEDELVLDRLRRVNVPVILAVNKVDRIADKARLLPHLQALSEKAKFAAVVPVSATRGENLPALEEEIRSRLPLTSQPLFPEDQITDRSNRFLVAELVREQLMRQLGQEIPYATTVEIEAYEESDKLVRIGAVIWVERPGQKAIIIGKQGDRLKQVGQAARLQIEQLLQTRVYLNLWVKLRAGWTDDERALRSLGYDES